MFGPCLELFLALLYQNHMLQIVSSNFCDTSMQIHATLEIQTNALCKQDFHVGIFVPVRLLDRETVQGKLSVC